MCEESTKNFIERLAFYSRDLTKEQKIKLVNFIAYKKWEKVYIDTQNMIELIKQENKNEV